MGEALPEVRVRMMVWLISGSVSSVASRAAAPAKAGTPGTTCVLGADTLGTARVGSAVFYRGQEIGKVIVGQNGILSTPGTSHIIRHYKAFGGFILSLGSWFAKQPLKKYGVRN